MRKKERKRKEKKKMINKNKQIKNEYFNGVVKKLNF